jgi:hypothetical protein
VAVAVDDHWFLDFQYLIDVNSRKPVRYAPGARVWSLISPSASCGRGSKWGPDFQNMRIFEGGRPAATAKPISRRRSSFRMNADVRIYILIFATCTTLRHFWISAIK